MLALLPNTSPSSFCSSLFLRRSQHERNPIQERILPLTAKTNITTMSNYNHLLSYWHGFYLTHTFYPLSLCNHQLISAYKWLMVLLPLAVVDCGLQISPLLKVKWFNNNRMKYEQGSSICPWQRLGLVNDEM